MIYKEMPWICPVHLFAFFSETPWAILLHSARLDDSFGRYSYIGFDPFATLVHNGQDCYWNNQLCSEPFFELLEKQWSAYSLPIETHLPPFQGGVLGLFGYELLHELETLPKLPYDTLPFPDAVLGFYDTTIAFDHHVKKLWFISTGFPEQDPIQRKIRARKRLQWLEAQYDKACLHYPPSLSSKKDQIDIRSNFTIDLYKKAVQQTKNAILKGDFFEANISQQFSCKKPTMFNPWNLYLSTLKHVPAPFSAFFHTPYGTLVSASPERFLLHEQNVVTTCPIKGTRPRHINPKKDSQLANELLNSEKDRAENIMIVDLMRNDLSKVCQAHTVIVKKLCALESFETVHHLVSTIQGTLKKNCGPIDLLKACFPGGSITGAPKVEVMKHIQAIEQVRRGPYCGCLGYIGFNENLDTSIVIRTFTITPKTIFFQTGGAVTLDSIPEEEYQETLDKANGLIKALEAC